jgi:hypothetical protein
VAGVVSVAGVVAGVVEVGDNYEIEGPLVNSCILAEHEPADLRLEGAHAGGGRENSMIQSRHMLMIPATQEASSWPRPTPREVQVRRGWSPDLCTSGGVLDLIPFARTLGFCVVRDDPDEECADASPAATSTRLPSRSRPRTGLRQVCPRHSVPVFRHVVMISWKPEAGPEQRAAAAAGIRSLPDQIHRPGRSPADRLRLLPRVVWLGRARGDEMEELGVVARGGAGVEPVARAFDHHQAAVRYKGGGRTPGEFEGA